MSAIFRLKQVLKMLHGNYITFQTQIKSGVAAAKQIEADVDLSSMLIVEAATSAPGAPLSKKDKRLLKKQKQ